MAVETRWHQGKQRALHSVFGAQIAQLTPTPAIPSIEQGQAFGGPLATTPSWAQQQQRRHHHLLASSPPQQQDSNRYASDQTRFDRSWHVVTSRIALPGSVTVEDSFGPLPGSQDLDSSAAFNEALRDVLDPASRVPYAAHTEDVLAWHTQQVRQHFVNHVLPLLAVCDGHADRSQVYLGSARTLEAAHRQYRYGLSLIVRGMRRGDAERAMRKFRRDLNATVGNSMSASLAAALRNVLSRLMCVVLQVPSASRQHSEIQSVEAAREEILHLVESLCEVGLAGERFQIIFAELLNEMMIAYINESFAGEWSPDPERGTKLPADAKPSQQPRCVRLLSDWVENHYSRLAVEVTSRLDNVDVSWTDNEKWKEIATGRLAALRISELFDIVIDWPRSEGGVEDLRYAVTTPQRRLELTDAFSSSLQKRLLHSGRSTLDILRTYIAMIRTFHKLDHSRVLLDRVAFSLQLYLCTREDTVRIIVAGLLSSPAEVNSGARETKLVELVELLYDPDQYRTERQDEEWDDLTWVPPPVDAGSNYKRRKSEDVIGTLIGALGSPEVFIKEFQSIIGERLLSDKASFEQEIGVLELLKKRFGEAPLQACDVMIKDVEDSRRLDGAVHREVGDKMTSDADPPAKEWLIHARILSRLYWPDMGDDQFVVPAAVATMQQAYEVSFERLKPSRKMKWLNHLGQATVELELEDRTIAESVHTYEAAVIGAFSDEVRPSGWSFEELWQHLQMDEDLLTAALEFWEGKNVLRRDGDGTYTVVERLDDAQASARSKARNPAATSSSSNTAARAGAAGQATPATTTPPAARKPTGGMSDKEREKRQVYWQFIVGMLTNSSSTMPLGQISMMMKMLIADGFPWSNEELQEFLGDKVGEGELEIVGGKYRLVKK